MDSSWRKTKCPSNYNNELVKIPKIKYYGISIMNDGVSTYCRKLGKMDEINHLKPISSNNILVIIMDKNYTEEINLNNVKTKTCIFRRVNKKVIRRIYGPETHLALIQRVLSDF